ncbi:MAG TPA: hypothetical protein VKR58_04910 [Aquella sp.]|nr:hypothetical protein [Aquella sp.]
MATKNVCDVKSCQAIIERPNVVTLGTKIYDLCQKCYDGFNKFLNEYLNPGKEQNHSISVPTPLTGFGTPFGDIKFGEIKYNQTLNVPFGAQWIPNGPFYGTSTTSAFTLGENSTGLTLTSGNITAQNDIKK